MGGDDPAFDATYANGSLEGKPSFFLAIVDMTGCIILFMQRLKIAVQCR